MMAVRLVVDKSQFANLKILTFSSLYDIIHNAGSEGRTFNGNVMLDKTAG